MIESKPVCLCVGNRRHRIKPVERKLCLGGRSYSLRQALVRRGGLIIGEGDTGKSTYVQMLFEAAARRGGRKPLLVKLRTRPTLTVPDVPEGEVQTIVWDGLDEFPECARDIVDLTADLDPERYHVWVTSRPCNAASVVAASPLLEDVYHLAPFAEDDVIRIAASAQLDGEAFLEAVLDAHLDAFLEKPGGAVILMQLFANGQLDSTSRIGLMETIMLDFARETRDGDAACDPKLPFSQRQIVEATGWIAACLVLTGKDAVWTGAKSACPANDLFIEDLPPREYGIALFKSALGLRLFEPLTHERYRLAYSDMPPFLAGRWLAKNFPAEKLPQLDKILPALKDDLLGAITYASSFDTAFGLTFIGRRPEAFLDNRALITEFGFANFVNAILKTGCSETADYSQLRGFDAFAKFLRRAVKSRKHDAKVTDLVYHLLAYCKSFSGARTDAQSHETSTPLIFDYRQYRGDYEDDAISDQLEEDDEPEEDEVIDIPTERTVAKELKHAKRVTEDGIRAIMAAERERGFRYLALQSFFDSIVFGEQKPDEALARPKMVGLAIAADCSRYLNAVVSRLPDLPDEAEDNEDDEISEDVEIGEDVEIDEDDELSDAVRFAMSEDFEEPVRETDAVSLSVCMALLVAYEANVRVFESIGSILAPDDFLRVLKAVDVNVAPEFDDLFHLLEAYSKSLNASRAASKRGNGDPLAPATLDALCRPAPRPVEAVVVEVAPSVREELGETVVQKLKNKGGRPKRSKRDGNYLSQGEVAKMFGPPCKTSTVSNWERFVRTNGQAGAQPPAANVRGRWIGYSPELRENYSGDNCVILAALIETYKSCHAVKTRLGTEKPVHAKNDETLYRLQHPDGRVRTENRE